MEVLTQEARLTLIQNLRTAVRLVCEDLSKITLTETEESWVTLVRTQDSKIA